MFNTTVHRHGPSHVSVDQKTTVTEHRAPTDASVSLLREMEAKAEETLLCGIKLGRDNNQVHARAIVREGIFEEKMRIQFMLNERPCDVTVDVPIRPGDSTERYIKALRDAIATQIANTIMIESEAEILPRRFRR